jgi:hypothetical protein
MAYQFLPLHSLHNVENAMVLASVEVCFQELLCHALDAIHELATARNAMELELIIEKEKHVIDAKQERDLKIIVAVVLIDCLC